MMRRLRALRPLSALVGLWFLVAGREVPFAHQCLAPSAVGIAVHENAPTPKSGSHSAHGSATPAEHAEHAEHPASPAPATPAHENCDCLGDCCAVTVPSLTASPHALDVPVRSIEIDAAYSLRAEPPARIATYRQPFAIGPPSPDLA